MNHSTRCQSTQLVLFDSISLGRQEQHSVDGADRLGADRLYKSDHTFRIVRIIVRSGPNEEGQNFPLLVDQVCLPDCFQLDCPCVSQFSVATVSVDWSLLICSNLVLDN